VWTGSKQKWKKGYKPLTHEIIHGEFGAIEWLNLKYALTPLPCQSHRDKCFEIHVFFICHFVL
jgi:hypothetical protein